MKRKLTILALVVGLMGGLLATAGIATGDPGIPVIIDQGVLRLHLGDSDNTPDRDYFRLDDDTQIQSVYNDAADGTFTLSIDGQGTTGVLDFNASASEIETELEKLPIITDVSVSGAGTSGDPWLIEFPPGLDVSLTANDGFSTGSTTIAEANGFTPGTEYQILPGSKCDDFTVAGPYSTALSAEPGKAGLVDDGFGVRVTGPQGTRCGQFDDNEVLILDLGPALGGMMIDYAELDIEIKFNATVQIDAFDTTSATPSTPVFSVEQACDDSDCGPDSNDGDNYRVLVKDPDGDRTLFNRLEFSVTSAGSNHAASLEGGADGTVPRVGGLGETLGTADSLFHIVEQFDGDLACQQTARATNEDEYESTFKRLNTTNGDVAADCDLPPKPYTIDATTSLVTFDPVAPEITANYRGDVTFTDRSPSDRQTILQYDREADGPYEPVNVQACKLRSAAPSEAGIFPELGSDDFPDLTGLLDADEQPATWCLVAINTVSQGDGTVLDTFVVFGNDDPRMSGA